MNKRRYLPVLVNLGCYNNYYRLSGLNNKSLFLTILETESSRSGYQHGQVWCKPPSQFTEDNLLVL